MRQFLICFVIVVLGAAAVNSAIPPHVRKIEPFIFEDIINNTLESIRKDIPETIKLANLTIVIPDELSSLLKGSADLSNFELTGLKDFQVPFLKLELVGMKLNFTFVLPTINLNSDYWGDLLFGELIPLYGDGRANIHIVDAELQGIGEADLSNGISIKNLSIQLYLGSATFDIHGALDNENFSVIISQVLTDVVASFIDNHQTVISNIFSPIIEAVINAILSGGNNETTTSPASTTASNN